MALQPGSRLGPYEIVSALGAGGMGEFSQDPERLARFQREAELLATLNHPNIAAIYGLEDGALVLELVEGPTLADRIARGALPLEEALPIARQIADALDAAHERGVIHRDLKPANIKIRPDGTAKVLDFGLAKALEPTIAFGAVSDSPTITSPAMTRAGVVLGTAAYMSPEQARGHPADKRSDVWAFGCVLYEMLTRRAVFEGATASEVLAGVLKSAADWRRLPGATPEPIRRLLRRCLQKDAALRLRDIADARLDLADALGQQAEPDDVASAGPAAAAVARSKNRERVAWITAGASVVALVAAVTLGRSGFFDSVAVDTPPVITPPLFSRTACTCCQVTRRDVLRCRRTAGASCSLRRMQPDESCSGSVRWMRLSRSHWPGRMGPDSRSGLPTPASSPSLRRAS